MENIISLYKENPKMLFWPMQIFGWIVCGFILFLSGLGHQSILSSAVRNGLLIFVGLGLSLGMRVIFKILWKKYQSLLINGLAAFGLSYCSGLITGLILNPITFIFFFNGLGPEPLKPLFAGVLNFALVYMCWSASYFAVKHYLNPISSFPNNPNYLKRLSVENRKLIIPLKMENISHFEADKDYIKIFSNDNSYLLRKTLRELETQLDPNDFQRIHRSYIVNLNFVSSLKPHLNGEYFVILTDGTELKMSRTYKHLLKSQFGAGV